MLKELTMKYSKLVLLVQSLFFSVSVNAASILSDSELMGNDLSETITVPGTTSIDVTFYNYSTVSLHFDNGGLLQDDLLVSLYNNTGSPWSAFSYEFTAATIDEPGGLMPVTGTWNGGTLTSTSAYLTFEPFESVALLNGRSLIGTPSQNYWLHLTPVSAVPVPAALWLFGSGLIALAGFARRRKS